MVDTRSFAAGKTVSYFNSSTIRGANRQLYPPQEFATGNSIHKKRRFICSNPSRSVRAGMFCVGKPKANTTTGAFHKALSKNKPATKTEATRECFPPFHTLLARFFLPFRTPIFGLQNQLYRFGFLYISTTHPSWFGRHTECTPSLPRNAIVSNCEALGARLSSTGVD